MESIDFVLAYPQAPIKTDIYMKPPKVPPDFVIPDLPNLKNLYGLKDAGKTWANYLRKGLLDRGWKSSEVDTRLYTKNGIILIVYVDDAILISLDRSRIDSEIKSLQRDYVLTDDGELKDYLGTRFTKHSDGSITLTQPAWFLVYWRWSVWIQQRSAPRHRIRQQVISSCLTKTQMVNHVPNPGTINLSLAVSATYKRWCART